jgi:hypothetical protein
MSTILSYYVRLHRTLLLSLTSFAQVAATITSTGTNFHRLRLGVVRIPMFCARISNTILSSVFTVNKTHCLQFDQALKALAAAVAPDEVIGPRVVLISDVPLEESFMLQVKECLPLLDEMGLVDVVIKSEREFEREVRAEIEDTKYLET